MLDHYRVVKVGDTSFTLGQIVEKRDLQKENNRIAKENAGGRAKKKGHAAAGRSRAVRVLSLRVG